MLLCKLCLPGSTGHLETSGNHLAQALGPESGRGCGPTLGGTAGAEPRAPRAPAPVLGHGVWPPSYSSPEQLTAFLHERTLGTARGFLDKPEAPIGATVSEPAAAEC